MGPARDMILYSAAQRVPVSSGRVGVGSCLHRLVPIVTSSLLGLSCVTEAPGGLGRGGFSGPFGRSCLLGFWSDAILGFSSDIILGSSLDAMGVVLMKSRWKLVQATQLGIAR